MSEATLRRVFVLGTLFFLVVLGGMTVDSLSKVSAGRTGVVSAQVARGKQVWQQRNCNDCHTILGIGGYFAPDLTKLLDRRDPDWLRRWLASPEAVKPGTTMPNQRLNAAEVGDLIAFLGWVRDIDTNGWPPGPAGGGSAAGGAAAGALLFQQKGCVGCHRVSGQGAPGPGPDLSHIASQPYDALPNTPEFLTAWLEDPAAMKPGTLMPRIPMSAGERETLVRYLRSLE